MSKNTVLNSYNFVSTSNRQPQLDSNQYELIIRQQPKQARLCSSKERDRRPVDPPPIIQLKVNGYGDEAQNFLQSPYYFMCANLMHPTDNSDSFTVSSRYLAGTVVSSLHKLKDIDNKDGGFFVFGDISVRVEGRYRLRFSLFEIIRDEVVHIQSVTSDVFTVYSAKAFPGMSESTFLSRSFSDQGVRIRIRKEHRIQMKRPQTNNRQSDNVDGDDDNINDDGIMDGNHISRKRSRSQIFQPTTSPTSETFDMYSSPAPYPPPPPSHHQSSYAPPPPHVPYSQQHHHQYSPRQRQGGGSLSYPLPLGYPQQYNNNAPQRQHPYYKDPEYESSSSRDDHTLSSPYYYNSREHYEHYEQYKRPKLSSSETMPYDYRQSSSSSSSSIPPPPSNHYPANSHHYNTSSPPPPPLPPPSSSSYRNPPRRRNTLSPLLEHQPSYPSTNSNAFSRSPPLHPVRHHSYDVVTSSTSPNTRSLDSFHYSRTATSTSSATNLQHPQPHQSHQSHQPHQPHQPHQSHQPQPPPSETPYYRPLLKTPVRSRTLPLYMNRNNEINNHSISSINNTSNDDNSDNYHNNNRHHNSTASISSNQLPTPQTSIDDRFNNKNQLYTPYPPTPPNLNNKSSSVDSYKNGNDNSNNLTPSFTQQFTLSPRPAHKSPLLSNNNVTRTSSLPVMSSSSTSSSNITTFLNDGSALTSSPQLLPTNNNRLPPITDLITDLKKKEQEQQQQYHYHERIERIERYNNNNSSWHDNNGSVNGNYE